MVQEINKKILSQDYTSFRVEILSADAQPSHKDGVIVVVTGCLTGSDNLKRKFTQSFFLAPQDKGYFVLNDIFRYIDEYKSVDIESVPVNEADESAPTDSFTAEPGRSSVYNFWLLIYLLVLLFSFPSNILRFACYNIRYIYIYIYIYIYLNFDYE